MHKIEVHDEIEKYGKMVVRTCENIEVKQRKISEDEKEVIDILLGLSEMEHNNEISQLLPEKLKAPKKYFLEKWQNDPSNRLQMESSRTPLTNMENVSRKTAKHASRKIKSSNRRKSTNPLHSNKENVKIHNIRDLSTKDINKELYSINF